MNENYATIVHAKEKKKKKTNELNLLYFTGKFLELNFSFQLFYYILFSSPETEKKETKLISTRCYK